MGRMFFNVLATFAEFEADPLSLRHCEGMLLARPRAEGQAAQAVGHAADAPDQSSFEAGEHTVPELAELFSVSRATVYRVIQRAERARLAATGG